MRHGQQITGDEVLQMRNSGDWMVLHQPSQDMFLYIPGTDKSSEVVVIANDGFSIRALEDLVVNAVAKSVHFVENPQQSYSLNPSGGVV